MKYQFKDTGTHKIWLVIENAYGCFDSTSVIIRTLPHPIARIYSLRDSQCYRQQSFDIYGDSSIATNRSNIQQYSWKANAVNGSTTYTSKNIKNIIFDKTGLHQVRLIVLDRNGCSDTTSALYQVMPHPVTQISINDSNNCTTFNYKLLSNSTLNGQKTGFSNYWSYQSNTKVKRDSIIITYNNSGDYQVELITISDFGCADTATQKIFVDTLLVIDFSILTNTEQCLKSNTFELIDHTKPGLFGLQEDRYWKFGDGDSTKTKTNKSIKKYTDTGYYWITLSRISKYGCSNIDSLQVRINPHPVTDIITTKDLACYGDKTATIFATSKGGTQPVRYLWNGEKNYSSVMRDSVEEGYYTVIGRDNKGCDDTADIYIKAPDSLYLQVTYNDPLCLGAKNGNARVYINGGNGAPYIYQWSEIRPRYTDTIQGLGDGRFKVKVTDYKGCEGEKEFVLVAQAALTTQTSLNKPVSCFGFNDAIVTAETTGGSSPYEYSINYSAFTFSDTFTQLAAGKYLLRISDKNGCINTDSFFVDQPTPLAINTTVDSIICYGDSSANITIKMQGGTPSYKYEWINQGNSIISNAPFIKGVSSGIYKAVITDNRKCIDSVSVNIPDGEKYLNRIISNKNYCWGSDIVLANKNNDVGFWMTPYSSIYSDSLNIKSFNYTDTGIYTFKSTNNTGCTYTDTIRIKPFNNYLSVPDTMICQGQPLSVFLKDIFEAEWYKDNTLMNISPKNELWIRNLQFGDSGQYQINYVSSDGCRDTILFQLKIPPKLKLNNLDSSIINTCEGNNIQINFSTNNGFNGFWRYPNGDIIDIKSNFAFNLDDLELEDEGTYILHGIDNNGCMDTLSFYLNVGKTVKPELYRNIEDGCIFSGGAPLYVTDKSLGSNRTLWFLNDSLINKDKRTLPIIFNTTGNNRVKLVITSDEGCTDSSTIYVLVNPKLTEYIPDAFTPNKDKLNPIFKPVFSIDGVPYKMSIYNRWGEKVYEDEGISGTNEIGWNGNTRGNICQEGIYVYIMEYSNSCSSGLKKYNLSKKGAIHLLR